MLRFIIPTIVVVSLIGCAQTENTSQQEFDEITVKPSFLEKDGEISTTNTQINNEQQTLADNAKYKSLKRLNLDYALPSKQQLENQFPADDSLSAAVDKMPVGEFLHYSLGRQLNLNYVLASDLPLNEAPITLNIKDDMSSRSFFSLVQDVLQQRSMVITENSGVYYVSKVEASTKGNVALGVGAKTSDVPNVATQILQIVPTRFGIDTAMERTLSQMVDATITPDFEQNVLFIRGRRSEILRAIELVQLLDKPINRGKYVGIVDLTFITADEYIFQASQLLANEGISAASGIGRGENVVFVPLSQIGSVAIFASDLAVIDRVRYWGLQLDRPATKAEAQYFVYSPKFARATDLGESIAPLLGQQQSAPATPALSNNNAQNAASSAGQASTGPNVARRSSNSVSNSAKNLSMVVDERSNSLIFYGGGSEYQTILPLIKKLDVLPKQILLDISVVEVTLTGQFQQGFEFALREESTSGNTIQTAGTLGSLGLDQFGGFSYVYDSLDLDIQARLFSNNSLVNVVSNPTIVVRDGVTASLAVGTDIPVIASQTVGDLNDNRDTTQFTYVQTGLQLDVKPTVNAQNIVLMEIDQFLSNTDDSISAQNPAFFERSLATEVVAKSGQTILLGGIISENKSDGRQGVPGLANIPILGNLFQSKNRSSEKTELVVLVTARVLDNTEEWDQILRQFERGLKSIKIDN